MTLHPTLRELLAIRGITADGLESFLDPSLKRLAQPENIPGLADAASVIFGFLKRRSKIIVFGDYDCDGVCACAITVKALRKFGGICEAFIPDRFTEGYGMTNMSVERMLREHPDVELVVTVDNGINSAAEVKTLKERGIAVVVTDHHLPPPELPECDALVDPKIPDHRDCASRAGCLDLCGAGIAFFLANALANMATKAGLHDGTKFASPLLALAGIATVTDIVPLLGQNRVLVANAIKAIHSRRAPIGVLELFSRARRQIDAVKARDFGFVVGPRVNAAGRIGSAREAYDLLMADDRECARVFAQKVDARNIERKTVENRMMEEAIAQLPPEPGAAVFVNDGETENAGHPLLWHSGVCGIVAARLTDRFGVPSAVVVGMCGSVRSPAGCDAHVVLSACSEHLVRFGGHSAAGGFTVKEGHLAEFRDAFVQECVRRLGEKSSDGKSLRQVKPDIWLEPQDITMELYQAVSMMEPFGEGNPEPLFGLRGVLLSDVRLMGENSRHASLSFAGRGMPRAVWWNHGEEAERLRSESSACFDIVFTIDVSDWGGDEMHVELSLKSISQSGV